MSIRAKMPALGIYRLITMGSQDLVIGARFTIWLEVATVPIMLTDARLVKVTVAVEKHSKNFFRVLSVSSRQG